jgi:microsomal dipeptidase-like Zn-dependent dipeptidase
LLFLQGISSKRRRDPLLRAAFAAVPGGFCSKGTANTPPAATPTRATVIYPPLYMEGLKEMADIVGVNHASIGTDQFDTRGVVEDYTRWVHLVAAMLRGGFTAEEAGKIAGGNYMRIFRAAVG